MASILLTGTLLDPNSDYATGDQVRFTHQTTTGETIRGAVSYFTVRPDGQYSIELQYGLILIEYKDVREPHFRPRGVVTVNQDSTATDLPSLLNAVVPPTDEQLLQFQAILADCIEAKDIAVAAAAQMTATELIGNTVAYSLGTVLTLSGYLYPGDGGGGRWKFDGVTGQTPSQSPAQLGDALLNDASGNQWRLVFENTLILERVGGEGALQAALNSKAAEVAWFAPTINLSADTYTIYSGQHLHGPGQMASTIIVNPLLDLSSSVFRNEAPNNGVDGIRYDKGIRVSGFTVDCSGRQFPSWLSTSSGVPITDPEADYEPGGIIGSGGDIFDVVAADRRNPDYSLNSSVFAFIKVDSPSVSDVTFINQNSFCISDLGCLSMRVEGCKFINQGKIDNISSAVWVQSNGNPKSPTVSFQDSEDHITEHCYFDCLRSAITLSPSKGGQFRFNHIERSGESALYVGSNGNYNGGSIRVFENSFGKNTITDIVANQIELSKNNRVYIYSNEFHDSNLKSIGVPGCVDVKIHDNTFTNQVTREVDNYPYGPFSERYAFGVGSAPVAGDVLDDYPIIQLSNQDSIGCDSVDIYNNNFKNDNKATYEQSIIGINKATGSNLMKNVRFRDNDASLLGIEITLAINASNVLNTEYSMDMYNNTGTDTSQAKTVIQDVLAGTSGTLKIEPGFRPRLVKITATDEVGNSTWQGELAYSDNPEPNGLAVNYAGPVNQISDEFYRTIDASGATVNKAEFTSYNERGFTFNVISSASDITLTLVCHP